MKKKTDSKKKAGRIPTKRTAQPVAAAKANSKAAARKIDGLLIAVTPPKDAPGDQKKAARSPRPESKKAIILGLLHREQGATISQIAEATGWQNHSIRGFISTAAKKMALPIQSLKNEAGDRIYRASA